MFWQQFSGTNSIGYYAPEIFQTIGISASGSSLFATGIYGTVKVVATGIFLVAGIDRWGRRNSLIWGAAWMSSSMFSPPLFHMAQKTNMGSDAHHWHLACQVPARRQRCQQP
jgi:MFS family permease